MATDIYMPQLGLTMTEGVVGRWLKAPGDPVRKGEPVVEIETDKVTTEIEAPADGVLGPILAGEGTAVPIGGMLSHVLAPGETAPAPTQQAATSGAVTGATTTPAMGESPAETAHGDGRQVVASPRARRLAYQQDIDLTQVEGTGPGGRIVEADIRWTVDQMQAKAPAKMAEPARPISPVARRLAEELGVDLDTITGTGPGGRIVREDVERAAAQPPVPSVAVPPTVGRPEPLQGIRRVVAERMTHSFTTTPHFYLTAEAEATALTRMREGLLARTEAAVGVRLTVSDILVKIYAQAAREFPAVNVAWVEEAGKGGLLRLSEINIGMAVSLDNGLVVPVIRQPDRLTLAEIARRRHDLVDRARTGKLALQDLEGGTLTLSNLGMFGVDQFQAIINSPQSAILAVGRIRERPIARDGAVVVRPTLYLTLSVDHRLLDGAQAARFLERIVQLVEEPYLLLS